jgi:hypothetical protein
MTRAWHGEGPNFTVAWGGDDWTLSVEGQHPGLRPGKSLPALGPLLSLDGVAAPGRCAPTALSDATLVGLERRHDRIEATYAPLGWGALYVRAAWSPIGTDGIDLEVQGQALSVGQLRSLEVKLFSSLAPPADAPSPALRWVEARDAQCASLSYDGREADLRGLTTLPPRESAFLAPRLVPVDLHGEPWLYAEMVHPHDISRRIREAGRTLAQAHNTRYALFGLDLEKGVVLRARLRAVWLRGADAKERAFEHFEEFLSAPLPLGT